MANDYAEKYDLFWHGHRSLKEFVKFRWSRVLIKHSRFNEHTESTPYCPLANLYIHITISLTHGYDNT